MRILLSNDDGYLAPGWPSLPASLGDLAEIVVVAPERNRSGASNSLTLDLPLHLGKAANGHMYRQRHADRLRASGGDRRARAQPDMVVSGINLGANMGDDTIYSGTVAAATEGYLLGVPAIAISLASFAGKHFDTAGRVVRELVQRFTSAPFAEPVLLNVNVPDVPVWRTARHPGHAPGTPSQGRARGEIGQPARRNAVLDRPRRSGRGCRRRHGFSCRRAWLGVGHAPADRPDPRRPAWVGAPAGWAPAHEFGGADRDRHDLAAHPRAHGRAPA
jgi:5'/3'-nucleotidase SurE